MTDRLEDIDAAIDLATWGVDLAALDELQAYVTETCAQVRAVQPLRRGPQSEPAEPAPAPPRVSRRRRQRRG